MKQVTEAARRRANDLAVCCQRGENDPRRDIYFMELYATLLDVCDIRLKNDECLPDENKATQFNVVLMDALKNFEADRGDFINYFTHMYSMRKDTDPDRNENSCGEVRILAAVNAYAAPDGSSDVCGTIRADKKYAVYAVREQPDGTWLRIRPTIEGRRMSAYVRKSAQADYTPYATEQIEYEGEDDSVRLNRDLPDSAFSKYSAERNVFSFEAIEDIMRMLCEGAGVLYDGDGTERGKLTQGRCFRMFFTEDTVNLLHQGDEYASRESRHEFAALRLLDKLWLDYLLTRECRSFVQIVGTRCHSEDHFLHNGKPDEISLPAEIGVKGGYIRDHLNVQRDNKSLGESLSRARSKFNQCVYGRAR